MKHLFNIKFLIIATLLFGGLSITSCSSDDSNDFKGENKIVLKHNGGISLKDNQQDFLLVDVMLVKALNEPIEINFELKNNVVDNEATVEIENPKVTIEAGKKTAQIKIESKTKGLLKSPIEVTVNVISNTKDLSLEKAITFTVMPMTIQDELTEAQIKLLDSYKAKGLDLYPLMGEKKVKTKVKFPGSTSYTPMADPTETLLEGVTYITLSEKATAEKPVLKMTSNPMGIEAYLYELFKNLTINDEEYWNYPDPELANPAPKAIMELIGLTPDSPETFEVTLDDIEFDLATKKISYISKGENNYEQEIKIVPFAYKYSAWDRLKKLIDEGNPIAIENAEYGGTVDPNMYLNYSTITDKTEYGKDDQTWMETTAELKDGTLRFNFILDHLNAEGFIQFETVYEL